MNLHNPFRNPGRVVGLIYLLMAPFGAFGILYIPTLIVEGDAIATIQNVLNAGLLYELSIISGLISQIIFVVLVLALYRLLGAIERTAALLMVSLVLVAVPIEMLNSVNYYAAKVALSASLVSTEPGVSILQAQMMTSFEMQHFGTLIAQIFWGLWLLPLGYLVYRSKILPGILSAFLVIACCGYLTTAILGLTWLDQELSNIELIRRLVGVSSFGELAFLLWLVFMGVNLERWSAIGNQAPVAKDSAISAA
jgi:hypothetical protein